MVWSGQDLSSLTIDQLEKIIEQQVQKIQSNNVLIEHKKQRLEIIQKETKTLETKKLDQVKNELAQKRAVLENLDSKINQKNSPKAAYLSSKGFLTAYNAVEEVLRRESRRFCVYDEAPPPDLIPRNEKCQSNSLLDPDSITIRNDTLRAAKRRSSWAADHEISATENAEAEHIKALLVREQQKGRSSVNLSWIFGQLPKNEEMSEKENDIQDSKQENLVTKIDVEEKIETVDSSFKSILKKRQEESQSFEVHYVSLQNRHIRFDPLALLLDAALEGDLQLVKMCSEQLGGVVDQSNGEGITALHNAICAGHYEIVRFLVEADADVNAQDSDGWTPLHCAASCNNLPAVQFLIERGACVFAQTLNDQQTPLEKCEEDSEGFDGCSEYLKNIQEKMGKSLNDARVFAAYPFEGRMDDEFKSMEIGQELIVLDRDRQIFDDDEDENLNKEEEDSTTPIIVDRSKIHFEDYWWLVKKPDDENVCGLVPRNYLALYPKLSIQRQWKTKVEVDR